MFVDLGYGFDARTTLESASRFRRVNPNLKILGVEIDRERVDAALPFAGDKTFFRLGGFNLPLHEDESKGISCGNCNKGSGMHQGYV